MSIDLANLRNYITAKDDEMYSGLADGLVMVSVTHSNLKQKWLELKFDLHDTVLALKTRLNKHCGTPVGYMELHLQSEGHTVAVLADNAKMLGFYSPANGMNIHIVDNDPTSLSKGGALEDVSLVKKFELTEDEYDKMENTVRAYKRNKLKEDPSYVFKKLPGAGMRMRPPVDVESKSCIEGIEVGMRCSIKPGDRRGEVAFVGKCPTIKPGFWVGVRFDEPVGKGNGAHGGRRYYECDPSFGAFVRPHNCKVGDFPPMDDLDLELTDSDEEDEVKTSAAAGEEKKAAPADAGAEGESEGAGAASGEAGEATAAPAGGETAAAASSEAAAASSVAPAAAVEEDGDSDDEL